MYISVPCLEMKAHFKSSGNHMAAYNQDQMLRVAAHLTECNTCTLLGKAYLRGCADAEFTWLNTSLVPQKSETSD